VGANTTFRAASVLVHGFALSEEDALEFIRAYNERCMPPWSERELRHKVRTAARANDHKQARGYLLDGEAPPESIPELPPIQKPEFKPEELATLAGQLDFDITPEWLEARSKFTTWNRSPAGVLHKLFREGEKVVMFNIFESQGCEVWEHQGNGQNLATLDYLERGQRRGCWFLAQPVTGEYVGLERLRSESNPAGRSRRCEECVTAWRYLLLESDHAPKDLWLRALVQLPLPISAIYDSGGDSIHALVRIDAESKAQWDAARQAISPWLVKLGACPGSMSGVRLTRLPNCRRESKKQLQRLLYLNDEPDCTPVLQKPVRQGSKRTQSAQVNALRKFSN
jgi:hypothetical protein